MHVNWKVYDFVISPRKRLVNRFEVMDNINLAPLVLQGRLSGYSSKGSISSFYHAPKVQTHILCNLRALNIFELSPKAVSNQPKRVTCLKLALIYISYYLGSKKNIFSLIKAERTLKRCFNRRRRSRCI